MLGAQRESLVDDQYVKLYKIGTLSGFTRLVVEDCPGLPAKLPKGFSLTWSLGYVNLVTIRNDAQSEYMLAEQNATEQGTIPEFF